MLGKYDVTFYQCPRCRFIQSEEPYWLAESYGSSDQPSDIGLVARNLQLGTYVESVLRVLFRGACVLDYGAGSGLLVRMMRDRGLDFWWQDRYVANEFARGCAREDCSKSFDLITAFEVFEHLEDPLSDIAAMLDMAPNIFFSTQLVPQDNPGPGEWWYYAPASGRHISIFSQEALDIVAKNFGLHLCSDGAGYHLLTREPRSQWLFKLALNRRLAHRIARFTRRYSFLDSDVERITAKYGVAEH